MIHSATNSASDWLKRSLVLIEKVNLCSILMRLQWLFSMFSFALDEKKLIFIASTSQNLEIEIYCI